MPHIPFGPFGPDDKPEEIIAGIHDAIERTEQANVDRNKMRADLRMLELRSFVESLDDNQLVFLRTLVGGLSIEGRDNYQTAMIHGILQAAEWSRKIDSPADVRFAQMANMQERVHHVQPVMRQGDDEKTWEEEEPIGRDALRDEPDDAA